MSKYASHDPKPLILEPEQIEVIGSQVASRKQDTLNSGVNIKTINSESVLGPGNIVVEGGTPYTHPSTHPATIITEDATHRFVTDTEKSTWNGKQNALGFTPANENHVHTEYAVDDHDHGLTYAVYAHAHTGVYAPDGAYEPALESPMADGYILSSDMAGNRSWIAPDGGGGLTQAQILTRML